MRLTKTKKIIGGLALAVVLPAGATLGIAQQNMPQREGSRGHAEQGMRHRDGRRGGMRGLGRLSRLTSDLNLSDAQRQIEQITARSRAAMQTLHEQHRALRENNNGMHAADGMFDEAAVRQAAQARANLHVEMEVARARMMSEVYAVLTPEQKATIAARRQQREQMRQERRARRGVVNTITNQ